MGLLSPSQLRASLSPLLTLLVLLQQVNPNQAFIYLDPDDPAYQLDCMVYGEPIQDLGQDCAILKFFNQAEVDQLRASNKLDELAKHCACELAKVWYARWHLPFDSDGNARVLWRMVSNVISASSNKTDPIKHPPYLWSDAEVVANRVSIYTATSDYFEQLRHNRSLWPPKSFKEDTTWRRIRQFCRSVSLDSAKLYRYLENVNRVSADVFMRLVSFMEPIEIVYQASKSCKMLLLLHFNAFKIRPDNDELVPVEPSDAPLQYALDKHNSVYNDVDEMLRGASALLMNCQSWRHQESSLQDLGRECPMMVGDKVPTDWIAEHPLPIQRSQAAIKCGCQLLMHNSTWDIMVRDPHIQLMSKMLTNYMNRQQMPNFMTEPVWAIHYWFQETMSRFSNRKTTIKEIIKTKLDDQDPHKQINKYDSAEALELLRRGCNFIMFNYKKGSKEASELKLIKYLDNLQLISQDPLFVFQLTLQDLNLFKLHALSKVCQPIVK